MALKQTRKSICTSIGLLFLLLQTQDAQAQEAGLSLLCQDFRSWSKILEPLPLAREVPQRLALLKAEYAGRKVLAGKVFESFITNELSLAKMEICWKGLPLGREFSVGLQQVFFERSFRILERAKSSKIQELVRLFYQKHPSFDSAVFLLGGHSGGIKSDQMRAWFDHVDKSLYMDASRISPEDWLVIFIHELVHLLDPHLEQGHLAFNKKADWKKFENWGRQNKKLSESESQELDTWLMHGLSRGLLGEYRAWSVTWVLYQEGLQENLWATIPWLEDLGQGSLYANLDDNFIDPTDSIFKYELLQTQLKNLRLRLRQNPKQVNLVPFERILQWY